MVRSLVWRSFVSGVAFSALLAAAVTVLAYLALQPPKFYNELLARSHSPAEQLAAERHFENCHRNAQQWVATSTAKQQAALGGGDPYDPLTNSFDFRVTDQQVNAQFAGKQSGLDRRMQNPRLRFVEGGVEFGFAVETPQADVVLSILLEPTVTDGGDLRLDIRAARIGRLPLPLKTILWWLPRPIDQSGHDLDVHLNATDPHLVVKLLKNGKASPRLTSIDCGTGELTIKLLPPLIDATKAVPPAQEVAGLVGR